MTETPARSRFGAFINLMFGYDGRIGRLYCLLGFLAFCAITGFFSGIAEDATAGTGDIGRYVAFVFIVGTGIWMHSAVTIKRLHDRDKSGLVVSALWHRAARALHRRDLFLPPRVLEAGVDPVCRCRSRA